jgi:hypothetical protein
MIVTATDRINSQQNAAIRNDSASVTKCFGMLQNVSFCFVHTCAPGRGAEYVTALLAAYWRVLWIVLAINAAMFAVEIGAGLAAGSAALQADALDF